MAIAAEGARRRVYLPPVDEHARDALVGRPVNVPEGTIATNPRWFSTPAFGITEFSDLFTDRQLQMLTTLSDLVTEVHERVLDACVSAGMRGGKRLADGGVDAKAYADAVATYLGLAVSRFANYSSALCRWRPDPSKEQVNDTFAQQALPMIWNYAEANPFSDSAGGWRRSFEFAPKLLAKLPVNAGARAIQQDALQVTDRGLLCTDPPYYDNVGYSDLSDFFYVWLRRSLRDIHPRELATMLVPKLGELVANPYRYGGKAGAKDFFETSFHAFFSRARANANLDYPITVFYAFKQAEVANGAAFSTGWESFLEGMVTSGWRITGTWPIRSEMSSRKSANGTNSLASSIALALRPRHGDASIIDRRAFLADLRETLPGRLRELQQGSIAAVDLPQAAIGPGMAVFSQYAKVVEADGSPMTVGSALQVINQVLGEVLWQQEGDFDAGTRWCVKWFESYGFDPGPYGEAETNASAFNTSVAALDRSGALTARGGKVQLLAPEKLPAGYDPRADEHITLWEVVLHLAKALEESGLDAAGLLFARAAGRVDLDAAKELAYLLFAIASDERRRWSGIAGLFNVLAASWSDVVDAARRLPIDEGQQLALDTSY